MECYQILGDHNHAEGECVAFMRESEGGSVEYSWGTSE